MSFGSSMRFEVKDGSKGGIFWQKEKPKQNQKKQFGYKSKEMRHPIRRPEQEYVVEEEESREKSKPSKDFIRRNRDQYRKPRHEEEDKENHHHRSSSSSSGAIKPGTVTLTQEQLNALLTTVGKLRPGEASNVRISIDAENNALQVETPRDKLESVPDSLHSKAAHRTSTEQEVSIFSLAQNNKAGDHKNSGSSGYGSGGRAGGGKEVRFDPARNEERQRTPDAAPAPPPLVPWRHMTVAERKRLQWAREKEAEEQLQRQGQNVPWGRPGDGAPQKQPEPDPHPKTDPQDELSENEKLRRAIDAIEAKFGDLLSPEANSDKPTSKGRGQGKNRTTEDIGQSAASPAVGIPGLGESYAISVNGKAQSSKRLQDKGNTRPPKRPDRRDPRKERAEERKEQRKMGGPGGERREEEARGRGRGMTKKEEERGGGDGVRRDQGASELPSAAAAAAATPAAMQTSLFTGQAESDSTQFLSKKELEKKTWLEELDRQREEKRLQKQKQKEKDREGLDDTWADRFVAPSSLGPPPPPQSQQSQQHTAYHHQQSQPTSYAAAGGSRERTVPQSRNSYTESEALPPAAMRSAMTIGNVAPNTDRIQQRQAEEKRLWLEELSKQREEQREARVRLKDRQRATSPEETWATRFTQDPRTTAAQAASAATASQAFQQRAPAPYAAEEPISSSGGGDGGGGGGGGGGHYHQDPSFSSSFGRVGSAPQPALNDELLEDESKTFLRGQNVHMDPVTKKELEDKRRKHLEYQAAIKGQIEEKERQKREEREEKWREEMEGERKLQAERDALQRQLEVENSKNRQKEEARQRQVEQLKRVIDAEQERAQEERMEKRLTTLQQAGHDITGLRAHYQAMTPRLHHTSLDPASVPGLTQSPRDSQGAGNSPHIPGLTAAATYRATEGGPSLQGSQEMRGRGVGEGLLWHEDYTENRVLTPSRYRGPGQHATSPHREFSTQTDGQRGLPNGLRKEGSEVEIEYHGPFHQPTAKTAATAATKESSRNVRRKSAERRKPAGNARGKPPPSKRTGNKPPQQKGKASTWNYQNPEQKTAVKQSEKDLFYEERRQESQERRAKRERQLNYLVELNKQVIPTERATPSTSHQHPHHHHQGESQFLDGGEEQGQGEGGGGGRYGTAVATNGDFSQRSRSPPVDRAGGKYRPAHRSHSPPVPSVRRRTGHQHDHDLDPEPRGHHQRGGREDRGGGGGGGGGFSSPTLDGRGNFQAPTKDTDFVPFMRTHDVLDPSRADDPVQLSREATRIRLARQNYHENLKPGAYGNQLSMYRDSERQPAAASGAARAKDPILNPGLVKDHPTARQDQILQQLSSLKQSLIQRRREIETCMSPSDLDQ